MAKKDKDQEAAPEYDLDETAEEAIETATRWHSLPGLAPGTTGKDEAAGELPQPSLYL